MTSTISSSRHYLDQEFKEIFLERSQIVSTEFFHCTFNRCHFVESMFQSCRINNCVFIECDLSLIKVPASIFSSTRFENSKVIGINWTQADWSTALGTPISFHKSTINHCTFIGLGLKGIQINECSAAEVDFRETDLSQADFAGTDLSKSLFVNTNLSEADLSRARNYSIDPGQNILKQAKFSLPEAMSLLYSMEIVLVEDI